MVTVTVTAPKSPTEIAYTAQRRAAWSLLVAYGLVWMALGAFMYEWWHYALGLVVNLAWARVWTTELGLRIFKAGRDAVKEAVNR